MKFHRWGNAFSCIRSYSSYCDHYYCYASHNFRFACLDIMLSYANGHSTRSQAIASAGTANPTVVINKYDPGRATRANQNPVCTHFTKLRRSIYPSSFFCTNCEWWEREVDLCNKRVNRKSKNPTFSFRPGALGGHILVFGV